MPFFLVFPRWWYESRSAELNGSKEGQVAVSRHLMQNNAMRWLVLLAPLLLSAQTMHYEIRPQEGATIALEVYKTGLMKGKKHLFVFERYDGEVEFDAAHSDNASIRFVVEANSAVCKDTWVSDNDRKKIEHAALHDMLAADRYPEVTFVSSRVTSKGSNQYEVPGTLTIRDKARPATLHATVNTGERLDIEGSAQIKLSDYGLKPPSAAVGLIGTKDEMTLRFRAFATH
jgi:polyisoprenoid-binding protein YceI